MGCVAVMVNESFVKLEWIETRTNNYRKLVEFYRDVLGLPVEFEEDDKDYIQFKVGKSDTYIAVLGSWKEREKENFIPAIEVTDLASAVAELKSKQVRFIKDIIEFTHIRLAEIEDPEGNKLQLFEFKGKHRK